MNKSHLLERLRRGDDRLLKEIYDSYREDFIRWVARFGVDRSTGEEIFQMSIIILYDNAIMGKLTNFSSSIKTYLFGIGKYKAMEYQRGRKIIFQSIDPAMLELLADDGIPENEIITDVDRLKHALVKLGDPCKQLLEMMYYQKLNHDMISELMGYKDRDTVKSKKYKCIARLRKILLNPEDHESNIT